MPSLFDEKQLARNRARAETHFTDFDFLIRRVEEDIAERLDDITRDFSSVLITGPLGGEILTRRFPNAHRMPLVTPESLTALAGQYDAILSVGGIHHANDVPGLFIQMRRALKPDGVWIAAMAGGETLAELRASLLQAELDTTGGASPRISPFMDKQQVAGLLQRAGFALPVVDSERISVAYRDMGRLMHDLRGMGEGNALTGRLRHPTARQVFLRAEELYKNQFAEPDGRLTASFDIVFLIGWAPHESQQQPAKRGSATISLADAIT